MSQSTTHAAECTYIQLFIVKMRKMQKISLKFGLTSPKLNLINRRARSCKENKYVSEIKTK